MKRQGQLLANIALLSLITLALASLQTSLWLQLFGFFPPPQIWIVTLAYVTIFRSFTEGVLLIYLISTIVSPLTGMPLSLLTIINFALFISWYIVKTRVYWPGATFLMVASGLGTLLFPFFHFVTSLIVERNPIVDIQVFQWIMSSLLTALVALPLHRVFKWADQLTVKELPTEVSAFNE